MMKTGGQNMKKLLHIIASPKGELSRAIRISNEFLKVFLAKYPDSQVDELNLFKEKLPELNRNQINAKSILMSGKELPDDTKASWKDIEKHIQRFLSADIYLISAPMWNFSIPYALKHYIDIIVQPKYLFKYTKTGPEGLAINKRMFIVTTRGGSYEAGSKTESYDHETPYLKTIFNFVGIQDISFIFAQPLDSGNNEITEQKINDAVNSVKSLRI